MNKVQAPGRDLEELVQRAVRGDRKAFGQLYDLCVDRIYKYLYYRLGNPAEAEDLTAQVFTRAWEAIERFREREGGFVGWIFRIAHNLLVDYFRAHHRIVPLEATQQISADDQELERAVERDEIRQWLSKALDSLTPEQQQVILLRFIEGYSSKEVAKIMGKSEEAVRAMQYRALASLNRTLGRKKKQ